MPASPAPGSPRCADSLTLRPAAPGRPRPGSSRALAPLPGKAPARPVSGVRPGAGPGWVSCRAWRLLCSYTNKEVSTLPGSWCLAVARWAPASSTASAALAYSHGVGGTHWMQDWGNPRATGADVAPTIHWWETWQFPLRVLTGREGATARHCARDAGALPSSPRWARLLPVAAMTRTRTEAPGLVWSNCLLQGPPGP